jgi:ribosomal protein S18 acetylase RimI-like enzyme
MRNPEIVNLTACAEDADVLSVLSLAVREPDTSRTSGARDLVLVAWTHPVGPSLWKHPAQVHRPLSSGGEGRGVIHHLAVRADGRGRGYGRLLVHEAPRRFSLISLTAEADAEAVGFP